MPPVPALALPTSQPLLGSSAYHSPHTPNSAPNTPATSLYSPNGPPPARPPGRSSARGPSSSDPFFGSSSMSSTSSGMGRSGPPFAATPAVPGAYYGSPLLSPGTPSASRFTNTSSGTQPAPVDTTTVYVKPAPDPWSAWRTPSGSSGDLLNGGSYSPTPTSYSSAPSTATSTTGGTSTMRTSTTTTTSSSSTGTTPRMSTVPSHVHYPSTSAASEEDLRRRLMNL